MVTKRWKTSNTSVYNLSYHIIWCPRYRKKILIGDVEKRLKEILIEKSKEIDVDIDKFEIMPDHVHIFVKTNPSVCPQWMLKQFKGYSSRKLREEFPHLKRLLSHLWTRSYYIESIGHISEDTIKKYIEDQKK